MKKPQNRFILESDLRLWVRKQAGEIPWWIEPSQGSTLGIPDCCIPIGGGRVAWLELKIGEMKDGRMTYRVRPEQRRQIKTMLEQQQSIALLVGVSGSDIVAALTPTEEALDGQITDMKRAFLDQKLLFCGEGTSTKSIDTRRLGNVELAVMLAEGQWPWTINQG